MTFQRTWRLVVLRAGGRSAGDRVRDSVVSDPQETLPTWGNERRTSRDAQGGGGTAA